MVSLNLWGKVSEIGSKLKTISNYGAETDDLRKDNEILKQEIALREKKYQSLYNEIQIKESAQPLSDSQYESLYKQLIKTFKNFLLTFFTEDIFIEHINEIFINIAQDKFFDNVYQLSQLIKPKIYYEFISSHQDHLSFILSQELKDLIAKINNVHNETFYADFSSEESLDVLNRVFEEIIKELNTQNSLVNELQLKIVEVNDKNKQYDSKYSLLNQNIMNMQSDCQDAVKKEKKFEEIISALQNEKESLQNTNESITLHLQTIELTLNNNITDLKIMNDKMILTSEKYEVIKKDKEIIESKLQFLTQENIKLKDEINSLKKDIELFSETNNEVNDKNAMIAEKNTEIENLISSYTFLEQSKTNMIKAKNSEVDTYKEQILQMSRKLTELQEIIENKNQYEAIEGIYISKIESLENQVYSLEKKNEELIQNEVEVKKKSDDLMKKVQKDLKLTESMIDKRVISSVLINYFDKNSNEKVKESLLETLSNIMEYSNEDRKKMGLKPILIPKKATDPNDKLKDVSDGLYDFIMNS